MTKRTNNKTFYNLKTVEINENNEPLSENYFRTLEECGKYYKCSSRLIGYKIKDDNKNTKGKLYNILIYKCKERIQYDLIEKSINRNFNIDKEEEAITD